MHIIKEHIIKELAGDVALPRTRIDMDFTDFDEYQYRAHLSSLNADVNGNRLVYPVLGLANEAGEVSGKVKKIFRDKGGILDDADRQALTAELGDVLWYLAEICTQADIELADVAESNLVKLASRMERGTVQGSGDNR